MPEKNVLDTKIQALLEEADIPGLSLAIIKNGGLWHSAGYGFSHTETKASVKTNSVFEAASLGKPLFGYLILKLADSGVLDLDTPFSHYLKAGFDKEKQKLANRITARMVLSHTTGLPNSKDNHAPLIFAFTPGQKFSYSGEGMVLLQEIVEHLTQTGLEQLMKQYVFTPLKMENTSFIWQARYDSLKVYSHNELIEVAGRGKPFAANAANSLHTTATDYALFLLAVLKGQGLKKKTYQEMIKRQVPVDSTCVSCLSQTKATRLSQRLAWGLGWGIEKEKHSTWIWHWGDNVNYKGFAAGNLETKEAIVYFANSVNGLSITEDLVRTTLGYATFAIKWLGYEPYNTPVKKQLKQIIAHGEKAVKELEQEANLKKFTSGQFSWLGQQLLNRRMYPEAIATFTISASKDSALLPAQLGLGEAYLKIKKRPQALKHLKKAIALSSSPNSRLERKIKILEKPEVTIAPEIAEVYVGKYKSEIGLLTITKEEGGLFVQLAGNPKEELLPDRIDVFVSADAGVILQFLNKKAGSTEIEITAGNQKFLASKIK